MPHNGDEFWRCSQSQWINISRAELGQKAQEHLQRTEEVREERRMMNELHAHGHCEHIPSHPPPQPLICTDDKKQIY